MRKLIAGAALFVGVAIISGDTRASVSIPPATVAEIIKGDVAVPYTPSVPQGGRIQAGTGLNEPWAVTVAGAQRGDACIAGYVTDDTGDGFDTFDLGPCTVANPGQALVRYIVNNGAGPESLGAGRIVVTVLK
jgi:hypothetical protein